MKEKKIPEGIMLERSIPENKTESKKIPDETKESKELPSIEKEENCIVLGGRKVEIKATKLKYFRNRTASIYSALKMVPLSEFLAYDKGVFDKERDSDQILFDF